MTKPCTDYNPHMIDGWKTRPADLFISTDGDDGWSGRLSKPSAERTDGPFATLTRGRDAVRAMIADNEIGTEGIVVEILNGSYEMSEPVELSQEDSGTAEKPVIYRANPGAKACLIGGRKVTGFAPVADQKAAHRIDPSVKKNIVCTNLRDQGISDFGTFTAPGWGEGEPGLELFFKGKRMTVARWPNDDFVKVMSIDVEGNTELKNRVTLSGRMRGSNEGRFVYDGDRPKRWVDEPEGWLHGYWFWDWSDQRQKIESIDTDRRIISMEEPHHNSGYRDGQWYYAFNILAELDEPGEWYLDRETGDLFFWPPEGIEDGDVVVSIAPSLVTMRQTSHVAFLGLTFDSVRGTAIVVEGGVGNIIGASTIRNTGSWGVDIKGGSKHGVVGCDLYDLGEGGVKMEGGDRATLTPGSHFALNNHVHHCSRWNPLYKPGVQLFGVGNRVAHNLLYELPHTAIGFTGNDQVIEFNEIHSVVYMANDAGAIYTSPPTEEFSMYGHTIRHNYVHHIFGFKNRGCNGAIYLDDFFPGTNMYGNVFYKVHRATFIGGGRYNTIENNIYVDCTPSVHVDARGLGWAAGSEKQLRELLDDYPYKNELWSTRYPSLVNVLDDEPMVPKGNRIARNICWKGVWDEVEDLARPHVLFEDNLVGVDPGFVGEESENFNLREDSPAYALGFKSIPIDDIGLYNDDLRASWPVEHAVREVEDEVDEPEDKTW
jgi:hypothetical protein